MRVYPVAELERVLRDLAERSLADP